MVEIGGQPILWHIMKIYSAHGIDDFIICLGYKGSVIKDYFLNYFYQKSDMSLDFRNNTKQILHSRAEPWRVTLVDTGEMTMVGGRIKRIIPYVADDDAFCLTYGDGVGDIDISSVIETHRREGRLATLTATQPAGRFGAIRTHGNQVTAFREKPDGDGGWINGGFFVLNPRVGDYIEGDQTVWEQEPLERLAAEGQLSVHQHFGFWHPMDSISDKKKLEDLWATGRAPWRIWEKSGA